MSDKNTGRAVLMIESDNLKDRITTLEKRCAEAIYVAMVFRGALKESLRTVDAHCGHGWAENSARAQWEIASQTSIDATVLASLLKPTMELLDWCEKVAANHHAYPLQSAIRTERQRLEGIYKHD